MQQNLEAWKQHYQNALGQRVEEVIDHVRKVRETNDSLEADYKEHKIIVNKALKLHETVIENKFKDIKIQIELDRKHIHEPPQQQSKQQIRSMAVRDSLRGSQSQSFFANIGRDAFTTPKSPPE